MIPHLFLDAASVAASDGVSFHLNQAIKHPLNPLLIPGHPDDWDSLQVTWPGTVLFDRVAKVFRCWYSGLDAIQQPGRRWVPGYAESVDGIHWTKPPLGQVEQHGRTTNRIRNDGVAFLSAVMEHGSPARPRDRFLGLWVESVDPVKRTWQKRLASSEDASTWDWSGPVTWDAMVYDISQLLVDADATDPEARVKAYAQGQYWPGPDGTVVRPTSHDPDHPIIRCIGVLTGRGVERLHEPPMAVALAPEDGIDDELHFAAVQRIGEQYLMLFESDRFRSDPLHGDLRLAVSEDGLAFRRVHPHEAVVPTGGRGTWDENLLVTTTAGFVEVADEVWIYYFGCPNVFRAWPKTYASTPERRGSLLYPSYLGLATLPRDRYAYARGPGTIVTRPMTVGSDGLWLNADGPGINVSVVDGGPAGPDLVGELSLVRTRSVYQRLRWTTGELPPGRYSLRIELAAGSRVFGMLS